MALPVFYLNRLGYFGTGVFICLLLTCTLSACRKKEAGQGDSFRIKPVIDSLTSLFDNKKIDEGFHYADHVLHTTNNAGLNDRYAVYTFMYAYFNYKRNKEDDKRALVCADSMLSIVNQNLSDPQHTARYFDANFCIGDCYFNLQQFKEAYQHYFNGYMAGKNSLNTRSLKKYTYRMGMITYKMGDYKLAADYFKKSYLLHTDTKFDFAEFYNIQEILDNIALSYKHNNQPDSALVYFNNALKFINKYGPQFKDRLMMSDMARGVVYGNKAEVLLLKGDYANASEMLKKSIAINLQKGYDNHDAELSEIKLAQLYYDQNEDKPLFGLLNAMRPQLDSVKNEDAEADWNRLMSGYYQQKRDFKRSLNYLRTYNMLKDSNLQKLYLLRENDINKQFDTYGKQQQIAELSNNNKLQKIYLAAATIVAAMTLLVIFLVYRNWIRSKKDVSKVNALNQQINDQNIVLENALNELKLNSHEKDRILRSVAHDLRNPLGGIASLTALMAEDEFTDDQKEQINLVKETSVNALELINEILEATNMTSVQLKLEWVDINLVASNSVELLRFKAAEKGQQIILTPLEKPQELYISREKIWRVISNLISNAIKFSPSGASIFVKVTEEQQQVTIAIEDNGIGIPEKLRSEVFNMFTKAQRLGTSGEKSFGLGLSICRQIMEKFNGKIWFESKNEGGTIFFISLPITDKDVEAGLSQKISIPLS